ncbi:CehA/McbA family metallohydrolase [Streptomyces rugosispiralis]|uniref:CehA/McbA family metallohydrolase n=1 Tax=Streptomyces rugosispiralis TaxID=2967341 RepID=A0ABT1V5P3_9ACTN|nr:CehA/McbA family metallohydrolase [Streptomyces rugosispiralis]MCQ8192701.1 CehA/McbA family metallohydrolase [Streptomyces rugosispiralis]
MCCEEDLMPPVVKDMLAKYQGLLVQRGHDWGNDRERTLSKALSALMSWCPQTQLLSIKGELYTAINQRETPGEGVRALIDLVVRALPNPLPTGLAIADRDGIRVRTPPPFATAGQPVRYQVFTVDGSGGPLTLSGATVEVDDPELVVNGYRVRAAESVETGTLRLVSDAPSRWSVVDQRGGAWFPNGVLRKYDYHGHPFFHGNDISLGVPAGTTRIRVARGCEFQQVSRQVDVQAGTEATVTLSPTRLYDAAARGWYGGDLHVHMNYSGDLVCAPPDAARMQQGEGLHVMNLLAANWHTALVYDREAFEHFIGRDLPWTSDDTVARWGVEYRNDLLGHFAALNLSAPPTRYQSGHRRSDEPQDWPPNAVAAAECRDLGATVGYTHPLSKPLGVNGSSEPVFSGFAHNSQARELVVDAALGLVDSVDLTGNHNESGTEATQYLYHRLLGCGLRLAATAGTDTMLSQSCYGIYSNPPGWARAYANLGGAPLSIESWQDAVRAGKTFATNGPWLELDVDGHGVGDTIALDGPARLPVTVSVAGVGAEQVEIVGPDGVIATRTVSPHRREARLDAFVEVTGPMWLAAVVRGGHHPDVLGPNVYAHTSPVWVDMAGQSVARGEDAAWCLDWIDRFERLIRDVGTFTEPGQLEDLLGVLDQARAIYDKIIQNGSR